MADKGGSLLQNVGMLLAPQATTGIMQLPLMRQEIARRQDQGDAMATLMAGLRGKQPTQDLNVSGTGPAIPANLTMGRNMNGGGIAPSSMANFLGNDVPQLAMRADPSATLAAIQARLNPPPIGNVGENVINYGPPDPVTGIAPVRARGPVKMPEGFKPGATREIQRGNTKVTQEFDGKSWRDIANGPAWKPEESAGYRSLTPDEMKARGLDPLGTYQIATSGPNAGKVDVVTQPKQTNPTEAQQKYAYNARRLADAMGAIQKVIQGDPATKQAADPGAISSGTLEATQDSWIPGMAWTGRALAGNNEQIVRNNMGDVIDAALTLGTGAAYNREQLDAARAALMPRAGEGDAVKADKFRKLNVLYDQAKVNAHSAGISLPDPSLFANIYGVKSTPSATNATKLTNDAAGQKLYESLGSGTAYIDPNGVLRTKK